MEAHCKGKAWTGTQIMPFYFDGIFGRLHDLGVTMKLIEPKTLDEKKRIRLLKNNILRGIYHYA